jgi:nucleotide-binding universal stress UspA family protein
VAEIRTIAVFLDESEAALGRLEYAIELATNFGSHVAAVFVELQPKAAAGDAPAFRFARGDAGISDAIAAYFSSQESAVTSLRRRLEESSHKRAFTSEWRTIAAHASLREAVTHGTYSDLMILPPYGGSFDERPWSSAELVIASGVPGLLLPARASHAAARHITVAWNASRVARRAVSDALPLLARAEQVTIIVVDAHVGLGAHGEEPGADIARLLLRHGVHTTVEPITARGSDVAEAIVRRAQELTSDLLVAGAYGHSRVVEMVLGSTTSSLLRRVRSPILISH